MATEELPGLGNKGHAPINTDEDPDLRIRLADIVQRATWLDVEQAGLDMRRLSQRPPERVDSDQAT